MIFLQIFIDVLFQINFFIDVLFQIMAQLREEKISVYEFPSDEVKYKFE